MASIDEIRQTRIDKLEFLIDKGINPYPVSTDRNLSVEEARKNFNKLETSGEEVVMAGRIKTLREQGKIVFVNFDDGTGPYQAFLKKGEPTIEESFNLFSEAFDMGDFAEFRGKIFKTKSGEETIEVRDLKMLAKSLRPLPEKWHGLEDVETRYRERELDILSDQDVRERFITRSKIVSAMRRYLDERGFLEFETPVLQETPGGANARPFVTHHNALDIDLYLRIATEIHLKRLIVAGYNKVYEIGRLFRNEGIDHAHNPEFTSMEMYWAYTSKEEYLSFLEDLIKYIVEEAISGQKVVSGDREIDFGQAWPRKSFREAVIEATGIDIDEHKTVDSLKKAVFDKKLNVDFSSAIGLGDHYDQLFKKTTRVGIKDPTWITEYPVELKPLANRVPEDKTKSASAQLIINGDELINAYYYELNDPLDQRSRFEEQEKLRQEGSEDAQPLDEQFLKSLEYGMPPTAGVGIGIDRLAMLLSNTDNIKEVILFPTLRPKN